MLEVHIDPVYTHVVLHVVNKRIFKNKIMSLQDFRDIPLQKNLENALNRVTHKIR